MAHLQETILRYVSTIDFSQILNERDLVPKGLLDALELSITTSLSNKADLVAGKVPASQLPNFSFSTFLGEVPNQTAMLNNFLAAVPGDWLINTEEGKTYMLTATPSSVLANWKEFVTPGTGVSSVNSRVGAVTLTASDVGLGNVANLSPANLALDVNFSNRFIVRPVAPSVNDFLTFNGTNWVGSSLSTSVTLNGDVAGPASATVINNSAVTTVKIADQAVTEAKLGNGAVTAIKLANNSVTTDKIANTAVTNAKLEPFTEKGFKGASMAGPTANLTVAAAQSILNLPENTIISLSNKLDSSNVKTINGNTIVGVGNIVIPGVTDGDKGDINVISSGAFWQIKNYVIDSIKIADGAVTPSKIGDNTLPLNKLTTIGGTTLLGNNTIGTSTVSELSPTTVRNMLGLNLTNPGLLGATVAGGAPTTITLGSNLSFSGNTLNVTIPSGGGTLTGGINVGTGTGQVFKAVNGANLEFRTIQGSSSIAVTQVGDNIQISTAFNPITTITSVSGISLIQGTSAGTVTLKSIAGGSNITIVDNGSTLTINSTAPTLPTLSPSQLLGRNATTGGAPEPITIGAGLQMSGNTLSASGATNSDHVFNIQRNLNYTGLIGGSRVEFNQGPLFLTSGNALNTTVTIPSTGPTIFLYPIIFSSRSTIGDAIRLYPSALISEARIIQMVFYGISGNSLTRLSSTASSTMANSTVIPQLTTGLGGLRLPSTLSNTSYVAFIASHPTAVRGFTENVIGVAPITPIPASSFSYFNNSAGFMALQVPFTGFSSSSSPLTIPLSSATLVPTAFPYFSVGNFPTLP